MTMAVRRLGLAALLLAAALAGGDAQQRRAGDLELRRPWIAEPPPGARAVAGYVAIANGGIAADRLLGARAGFAREADVHRTVIAGDGVMRMRPLERGLEIPAGGGVALRPGGHHLMFVRLLERPVKGETVAVTLLFERAGAVEVDFPVEAATGASAGRRHEDGP